MSRPAFLADHDLNENIVDGALRREPSLCFVRARQVQMDAEPDGEVLRFAAENGLIVVSHDVNTMPAAAFDRLSHGQPLAGLIMARQTLALGRVIEDLVLAWSASTAEEWRDQICFLPLRS